MRKFTKSELGVKPIKGPYSRYLNWSEISILIALVESVRPKVMIEFGCNEGLTAARVLENVPSLEKYIGIDVPSTYVPTLSCQLLEVPLYAGYLVNDDRFQLLSVPSAMITVNDLEPCDVVFVDGDHSKAAVLHESRLAALLLRQGGIICWHDYGNPAVEVTQALDHLHNDKGWPINCVENSWIAFMRLEKRYAYETA